MAQKEHIPPEVQDIILQHHGVTPVMYFYHKALQLSNGQQVDINEFRYAGPKPTTKEAAIVMLADTIEAAVRSMKSPTPKAIDQFIERLVRGKLEDGQLTDSPLSLRDIDDICSAFSDILKGVYHERIEYPNVPHYASHSAFAGAPDTSPDTSSSAPRSDSQGSANTGNDEDIKTPEILQSGSVPDELKDGEKEFAVQLTNPPVRTYNASQPAESRAAVRNRRKRAFPPPAAPPPDAGIYAAGSRVKAGQQVPQGGFIYG